MAYCWWFRNPVNSPFSGWWFINLSHYQVFLNTSQVGFFPNFFEPKAMFFPKIHNFTTTATAEFLTSWWFQIFFFHFHPYLGKISNLTSIFFRWVGSTTNQLRTGLCFDWDHASFGPVQCLGGTQLEVREIDSKRWEKIQGGVKPGSRRIGGIRSIITQLATFIYIYIQVVYKWYFSCQLGDYISPIPPMKGTRNNHRKIVNHAVQPW